MPGHGHPRLLGPGGVHHHAERQGQRSCDRASLGGTARGRGLRHPLYRQRRGGPPPPPPPPPPPTPPPPAPHPAPPSPIPPNSSSRRMIDLRKSLEMRP